ncbi:PKD domain-containing protein [Flavobacterium sp.]|uniref:PKD domain-containing protein n=1 Tax=Flavobacterium sp. TaxID=239 RepID=UPI00286E53F8|nr:PKD domain-containing protein [Flavobacterium sp.]
MKKSYKTIILFIILLLNTTANAKIVLDSLVPSKKEQKTNGTPIRFKKVVLPAATLTGTAKVCLNETIKPVITFTGKDGTAPYTFIYTVSGIAGNQTIKTTTGNSVTVTQATSIAGAFTYRLISVTDATNATQPITVADVVITVAPKPVSSFTTNASSGTCSGSAIQFTSNPTIGTAPYTYDWDFGDGTTSKAANPSHIFSSTNALGCATFTFAVKLTVTDSFGCVSTTFSQNILVKQRPNFEVTDSLHPFAQFDNCANASTVNPSYEVTVANNLSVASSCITSYSIDWGDKSAIVTSAVFPMSHTYAALGAYNLIVTAFGSNGCNTSKTYVVKNVSNPSGGISSPGNTQNLCSPTADLQFGISNWGINSPGTIYEVNYGDNSPLETFTQETLVASSYYNAANPVASANYPIPHTYKETSCPAAQLVVVLVVTNACGSTPFTTSNISILSKPKANFTIPATGCVNKNVLFTNTTIEGYSQNCAQSAIYTWDFGDGSPVITTPLQQVQNVNHTYSKAGVYTITMSAANYCGSTSVTKTICIEPALTVPTITLTPSNTTNCIPLTVKASTPNVTSNCTTPIEYSWLVTHKDLDCDVAADDPTYLNSTTSSSQNPVFNFTAAGEYTIQLQMKNSCGVVLSSVQKITVKKPPKVSVAPIANLCGGTSGTTIINPTATIQNCGFTNAELVYNWSFPGGTPATSAAIAPQVTYTTGGSKTVSLFISVVGGCTNSITSTETFGIGTAPTLGPLSPATQTICSGSSTTVVPLTAQSGTTFSWDATTIPSGVNVNPSFGNANSIPALTISNSNTTPKTVTLTITSTLDGCPSSNTYNIVVNPGPTLTQPIGSTICAGGTITPLTVTVSPTPAAGTATYKWYSNTIEDTTIATSTLVNTSTVDGSYLPPQSIGTLYYFCEVTFSASGSCPSIKSKAVAITVNPGATINPQPIQSQSICVGTTLATPLLSDFENGTGSATYQWYKNTTDTTIGGTEISGAKGSSYMPPVFAVPETAYYYVTITFSGNGCGPISCNPAEIKVFADPTVSSILPAAQSLCSGVTPTNLTVSAVGEPSVGNLTYQWFSNTNDSTSDGNSIPLIGETKATFTPPTNNAGTTYYYCVVSQIGLGCETTSSTVSITVNLAAEITKQPQPNTICLGETPTLLEVAFINGVGTPQYQWYSNSTNSIVGSKSILSATDPSFAPPSTAGTVFYYCKITLPTGGCSELNSDIVEVTINQNPVIANKTSIICSGNTFTILPSNAGSEIVPIGTTYTWSNPIISPPNAISGASGETIGQTEVSQTLINTTINPVTVTYIVTPIVGVCSGATFSISVTVNPSISNPITLKNSSCFAKNNGSIQTNITGGIPFSSGVPYQISWTGPNGFTATDTTISNLAPGAYDLTITDDGGCPFSETYTITEPDDIIITTDLEQDITCFNDADGKIEITVTGGTLDYSYSWTKDGNPFSNSEDITNLSPATYTISVTDANSCDPKTVTFTITEPPILAVSLITKTDILCYGDSTGAISINTTGGTPIEVTTGVFDYNYSWTGPNGFTSSNQNLNGVPAGTYELIVTDNSGCTKTLTVTLTQTSEIIIDAKTTIIKCYGGNNASISVALSGGIAPYEVSWSNFAEGLFLDNLSGGDYEITVKDALSCIKTLNITIPEPPLFKVTPDVKNISCFGANDGRIDLKFVGGVAPVSFAWTDNPTAGSIRNNLQPGNYTVTISDGTPCSINQTFVILEPQELMLTANTINAFDCDDANSGSINLLVSGGSAPFTYAWTNGATTEDLGNIPAGNYLVTVTDKNGCTKQAQYSINRPPPIVTVVATTTDFDCDAKTVKQTFVADVSGGMPPYQLVWSSGTVSGANNEFMDTTINGTVLLEATDALGCKSNYTFTVDVPKLGTPSFDISSYAYTTYGTYSINDPIQFTNTATEEYVSIIWDFGDGTTSIESDPLHTFVNPKEYVVTQTVTYPFGCVYIEKITLIIEKGYVLVVPTAFTPNNDRINDTFRPVTRGLKNVRLDIYDTWGSMIYSESGEVIRGWDGKIKNSNAENGNYYFKISGETFYGTIVNENHPFVLIK